MSGFTTLTPPQSPKFDTPSETVVFENVSEDFWGFDDFSETTERVSSCFTNEVLGRAFKIFLNPAIPKSQIAFPENFSLLWGMMSRLNFSSGDVKATRSNISRLLLDIFASYDQLGSSQVFDFTRRFVYLIKGIKAMTSTCVTNQLPLSHIQLDIWAMFFKLLESPKPGFEKGIKEALELEPFDANPLEYFIEVLFDILACDKMSITSSFCQCYAIMWILLIRHGEKVSTSWFKHLHGRIIQIKSGRRRILKGCLDGLRPTVHIVNQAGFVDLEKLWHVYWSVLTVTAPLCSAFSSLIGPANPPITNSTLKYSTAVWIIRNQFLADSGPNEESSRYALRSLLELQKLWGPSVEVVRPLWLYFSRKLDSITEVTFNRDDQSAGLPPFLLFAQITVESFLAQPSEVLSIIRTALPSLTRQGVTNYFSLLEHLLDTVLKRSQKVVFDVATLIEFVTSLFGGVDAAQMRWCADWETGRQCSALRGLQSLVVVLDANLPVVGAPGGLESSLTQLLQLTSQFRQTLVQNVKAAPGTGAVNNLAVIGWRGELYSLSLSFCEALLTKEDASANEQPGMLLRVLDGVLIDALCTTENREWLGFVSRLLRMPSLKNDPRYKPLTALIWNEVLPIFVSRGCTVALWWEDCVGVALHFLTLSIDTGGRSAPVTTQDLLARFTFTPDLPSSFRRGFLKRLFADADFLKSALHAMSVSGRLDVDDAWQVYTIWLTYRLVLYDDCGHAATSLTTAESVIRQFFPDDMSDLLASGDPEISLMRLSERFEACEVRACVRVSPLHFQRPLSNQSLDL
uniref:MMS22L_C domain-containing protein n=1 Tax=Mesocestoides corti TaxID=53468 RepID=A0A5K3FEX1_MESCO